ncbi:hypothetical protein R5R35_004066 [Gryllus longicercus]|uniref:Uncharacterized protein n=1 Tax=Gryllus longicercus TaxID=2509291 RepID=A0AAN9YVF7_9ORTH
MDALIEKFTCFFTLCNKIWQDSSIFQLCEKNEECGMKNRVNVSYDSVYKTSRHEEPTLEHLNQVHR